jgi:hypothetical protein
MVASSKMRTRPRLTARRAAAVFGAGGARATRRPRPSACPPDARRRAACRQILWEFGGNLEILLANLIEDTGTHWLEDLLPLPFDARLL